MAPWKGSVVAGGRVGKHHLGVAPGATVLVVRVARPDGTSSLSKVLGGLDWIAAHPGRVDVANLSFSHTRPMDGYGADPLTDAVERVRDAGVAMVVASGNKADQVGDLLLVAAGAFVAHFRGQRLGGPELRGLRRQ